MAKPADTPSAVDDVDARWWLSEIEAAKERSKSFWDSAKKAVDRYKDEKERIFGSVGILWANVETQKAALGSDFGTPQVSRTNAPEDDGGLTRQVALVWERTIDAAAKQTNDNHDIKLAANDVLLPGRGQVWLELVPHADEQGNVTWVEAPLVRVQYDDYLEGPANRWGDVPWVARGHLFTLDDLKRIGVKNPNDIPRNYQLPTSKDDKRCEEEKGKEQFKRARVWEVWSKAPQKRRIYIAEDYHKGAIKVDPDPYRLERFFPCPRPMLANGDEGWQQPITDYSRYQDQAAELDRVSQRIYVLTEILKNHGCYDKKFKELADLPMAGDNVFVGIENYTELMTQGGLGQAFQAVDLQPTVLVLTELHKQRAELINLIYELSGISDLARGMTDPDETLGAQKLKQSFGSSRFKDREKESRRFAAEAYGLKGELIAEHFPREQIQSMSGMPLPTQMEIDQAKTAVKALESVAKQAQQSGGQPPNINPRQVQALQRKANAKFSWEDLAEVLRSDERRCYRCDVETDQTAFRDEEADKSARIELLGIVNQLFQTFGPMIQGNPANGEVFKQFIMFVVSGFKAGRSVEEGIEQSIDNAVKMAAQAQSQPQQDPKAEADKAVAQARVQTAQTQLQTAQVNLQRVQVEGQNKGLDVQAQAQQTQLKAVEGQQKVQAQHDANAAKRQGQVIDNVNRAEKLEFERQTRATAQEALLYGPTKKPQNGASGQ